MSSLDKKKSGHSELKPYAHFLALKQTTTAVITQKINPTRKISSIVGDARFVVRLPLSILNTTNIPRNRREPRNRNPFTFP